jgi:hypothetical protein
MRNQIFRNYLFHLLPAFLIPLLFYLDDMTIPLANLLKIDFLVPLLLLATRGLATYFPKENFARRSTVHLAEHVILQGLLMAAVLVIVTGLSSWNPEPDLGRMLRQFAISATVWFVGGFAIALYERKRLNSPERWPGCVCPKGCRSRRRNLRSPAAVECCC